MIFIDTDAWCANADQRLSYEDAVTVALVTKYGVTKGFSYHKHFLMFPKIVRVP
jgi:predicted nucleic acid-binding protein